VCLALVVSREGFPLGYEVFAGNRVDVTTVKHIVGTMEERFGLVPDVNYSCAAASIRPVQPPSSVSPP
jgi:transposase